MYYRIRSAETLMEAHIDHGWGIFGSTVALTAVGEILNATGWSDIPAEIILAAAEDRVAITVPARSDGTRPAMVLCPRLEPLVEGAG